MDDAPLAALSAVSSTALVTALARAAGDLEDPEARSIAARLQPLLARSETPIHQRLSRTPPSPKLSRFLSARARHFDDAARAFRKAHPDGVVVNLACGLDTRFHRLGGRHPVIDVDLPPMIALKQALLPAAEGHTLVAGSVTERGWLDAVPVGPPVLFLAEGLLMYLPEDAVRALLLDLAGRHPGSELVAEVFQERWLSGWRGWATRSRNQRLISARFQFGLRDSGDMEAWGPLSLLGEWSSMDALAPPWVGRWMPGLRKVQWVVHYRLGEVA